MPNQIPVPKFKKGDKVCETFVLRLNTSKKYYKTQNKLEIKPKKGVIVSDPYKDKPDKAGRRRFKYDVQWDGRTKTDSMYQSRIYLEGEE
tara:strand:- start:856 stop:1125 length:270 start_codon:yes stop_codon:yes gene_type:complete